MSLQSEVRRVAREILDSTPRIDVLINNAGAWFVERQVTAEGLEKTYAWIYDQMSAQKSAQSRA